MSTVIEKNATGIGHGSIKDIKVVSYPRPDYPTCEEMDSMYQEYLLEDAKDIELELKKGRKDD